MTDSEKIEILIDQVGRLGESITEMRLSMESGFRDLKASSERQERSIDRLSESITEMRAGITEMRVGMESGFRDLKAVSERQERNIDRLVGIVETLIQPQRSQG